MDNNPWTRAERLAAAGLVISLTIGVLALLTPEVRAFLGLSPLRASRTNNVLPELTPRLPRLPSSSSFAFAPRLDFATGRGPLGLTVTDFDGDGKPDVAVAIYANGRGDRVGIFRNTGEMGSPEFSQPTEVKVGTGPEGLAAADLDSDGKPDLVTANAGDSTLSLLRNVSTPGSIEFESLPAFELPTPHRIAIVDLDRDGRPDLIASSNSGKMVSVYHHDSNSGIIEFDARTDLAAESFLNQFAIDDIDADGNPDILIPLTDLNRLAIYRNLSVHGAVRLELAALVSTGALPDSVATLGHGDSSGADVIVGSRGVAGVTVLRNRGGNFVVGSTMRTGASPSAIAVGDLDGDGRADVVVANGSGGTLTLLKNTGTRSLVELSTEGRTLMTGAYPLGLVLEDVDGDNRLDIVTTNHEASTLSIFVNITN